MEAGSKRARVMTVVAIAVFVAGSVAAVANEGLILSREWAFAWAMLGLLALSLTDIRRWARGLIVDWLPFIGFLVAYDIARGAADNLGIHSHASTAIDVDRALFGWPVPTNWLQQHIYHPPSARWYDYGTFGIYLTHFFTTVVIAVLLWRFAYPLFKRFRTMVLALAGAGFLTYALFPATPPWMAAQDGRLPEVHRVVGEMWGHVGIYPAQSLFEGGSGFVNDVAAVPSLHAAYPVLFMLFFWRMARTWQRVLLAAYPLAMAFTLVYSGEHYVTDVLLGWVYAVAVYSAVAGVERLRARGGAYPEPALGLSSSRVRA
jgi:membrane-associated phospholipid phosphatase